MQTLRGVDLKGFRDETNSVLVCSKSVLAAAVRVRTLRGADLKGFREVTNSVLVTSKEPIVAMAVPMGVSLGSRLKGVILKGNTMGVFPSSRFLDGTMALPFLSFQGGYSRFNLHGVKLTGHVKDQLTGG